MHLLLTLFSNFVTTKSIAACLFTSIAMLKSLIILCASQAEVKSKSYAMKLLGCMHVKPLHGLAKAQIARSDILKS